MIIYKIIEFNNLKHSFICTGRQHAEDIQPELLKLGYECIEVIGNKNLWDYPGPDDELLKEKCNEILESALNIAEVFEKIKN